MRNLVFLPTLMFSFMGLATDVMAQQTLGGPVNRATKAPQTDARTSKPIEVKDAQLSLIQNTFIASPLAGIVETVSVTEGDSVRRGDAMVMLNNDQVRTEMEAAEAAFEAARLQADNDVDARYARRSLEVSQRELEQSADANRGFAGAISDTEIAKLQLVVDQSRLAIEQAEHELQVATAQAKEKAAAARITEARLEKHNITAPVAGTVVEVAVEAGEWIEPGKPAVRLISLDPIRAECFIDGRKHGKELVGRAVEFTISGTETPQTLTGTVTFVSPEVHPVTGQARLWAELQNPNQSATAGLRGRLVIRP